MLQRAANDLRPRFPSFFVTLHKGAFWYYLEESAKPAEVRSDYAYPLTFMSSRELRRSCLRILYYKNRIAVEFFHSLTDGRGGTLFAANLAARYLELKYGLAVPRGGKTSAACPPATPSSGISSPSIGRRSSTSAA